MKFVIIAIACFAFAYADVSELSGHYDYHQPESSYLAPSGGDIGGVGEQHFEHHQGNNGLQNVEAAAPAYLPPAASQEAVGQPVEVNDDNGVSGHDDGYRYKTVRRVVYRHRH